MKKYLKSTAFEMLTSWKHIPGIVYEFFTKTLRDIYVPVRAMFDTLLLLLLCFLGPFFVPFAPLIAYLRERADKRQKAFKESNSLWDDE